MENTNGKRKGWLLPATLILFILSVLTLPLMVILTYAGRSESPEHLLTFADEKLTWDENTEVGEDGIASLSFFKSVYQNVESSNEDHVFAPGTEKTTVIRLFNDSDDTIEYTAISWMIKECDILAVYGEFESEGSVPTTDYAGLLPEGVTADQLLGAVTGTVDSKAIRDFDINWFWEFERGELVESGENGHPDIYEYDSDDTYLGNKAAWDEADDALIGFAIIVEGETPVPPPPTGEGSMIWWGVALVAISGTLLLVELIVSRRQKKAAR